MNRSTELVCQSWPIHNEPTADSIAHTVKALLMLPATIKSIKIEAPIIEDHPVMVTWEAYVPTGVPPETKPKDVYSALLQLDLIELTDVETSINLDAIQVLLNLFATVQKKQSLVGVGLLVGSEKKFRHWVGMEDNARSNLFNMPIIELPDLGDESVVLLCAKGHCDPLDAIGAITYRFGGEGGK